MVTLGDLAPILAAVVGPMLAVMFAMMRYQHVDSVKTRSLMHQLIGDSNRENRELIATSNRETREFVERSNRENRELIRENRELIEASNRETREFVERSYSENRELIRENRELIEKNHSEVTAGLGEVRERLSYIEGYLRQSLPPPPEGDAQAA